MESAGKDLAEKIALEKFRQYIFFNRWRFLKRYCNDRGILIMGDMPIYLSHDSADVWSHLPFLPRRLLKMTKMYGRSVA